MLTDLMRRLGRGIVYPIARFVGRTGLSPNAVTVIGFLFAVVVAAVLAQGQVRLAGILLIPAAIVDAIDGAMARVLDRTTRFGAFLDSTLDRLSEAALFLGALIYVSREGTSTDIILVYVTIVGSLMVSYTRARAEGLGISIKGGIFTRFERIAVLIIALILNQLTVALWVLAPLTSLTVIQRVWLVWLATRENDTLQT